MAMSIPILNSRRSGIKTYTIFSGVINKTSPIQAFLLTFYSNILENSFDVFPMALSKFLGQHQLQELHFSLSKGLWKHRWGYPVRDSPPGAELWVWFQKWNLKFVH